MNKKIDIRNIRIGNWLQWITDKDHNYHQVSGIDGDLNKIRFINSECWVSIGKVRRIPLNENILIDLGFKKLEDIFYSCRSEKEYIKYSDGKIDLAFDNGKFYSIDSYEDEYYDDIGIEYPYLDQLQNIIFINSGREFIRLID